MAGVAHRQTLLLDKMVVLVAAAPVLLVRKPLEVEHQDRVLLVRQGLIAHIAILVVVAVVLVLPHQL